MADPFVIYTLGDTALFEGALNGVAMLFKDTDLLSGNGYMGLGFGAFFGAMILLVIMVYNAAFKQQFDLRTLLAPLFLYIVLTVPKVDVAIYDIYGLTTKKVDNIPIGLAIPASVASGISKIMTEIIETAYQTVNNNQSYMPRITQDGYVTPLKLLNSLRNVSSVSPSPFILETVKSMYQGCLMRNESFSPDAFQKSDDPMGYIITAAGQVQGGGVVTATLTQNGVVERRTVNCKDAAKGISDNLDAYINGITPANGQLNMVGDVSVYNLNRALQTQMTASGDATGATSPLAAKQAAGGQGFTNTDLLNAFANLAGLTETQSRQFVASTLFNPMLQTASHCAEKYGDMAQMSKCTAWVSSINQWEEKNAAAATGFLKVMKDGQNILIMLSFLLFPIIVVFIMVQGTASFKILGNYMAFTVAAYLWLPMASIVNFYIQTTLSEEFFKVSGGGGGLNLVNGPLFYAAVAQKLSLANGLLASVPVLCMMLFSGMMMGMNTLAGRMNSADGGGYDAKVNSPDAMKSAPIASTNSAVSTTGQGVGYANGVVQSNASISSAASSMMAQSQALSSQQAMTVSNATQLTNSLSAMQKTTDSSNESSSNTTMSAQNKGNSTNVSNTSGANEATGNSQRLETGNNADNSANDVNASANATAVGATAGANLGSNPNLAPKGADGTRAANKSGLNTTSPVLANGHAGINGGGTQSNVEGATKSNGVSHKNGNSSALQISKDSSDAIAKAKAEQESNTFGTQQAETLMKTLSKDQQLMKSVQGNQALSKQWSDTTSAMQAATATQQTMNSIGTSIQGDAAQVAGTAEINKAQYKALDEAGKQAGPEFQALKAQKMQELGSQLHGNPVDLERAATVFAAFGSGNADLQRKAAETIGGSTALYEQGRAAATTGNVQHAAGVSAIVQEKLKDTDSVVSNATANLGSIPVPKVPQDGSVPASQLKDAAQVNGVPTVQPKAVVPASPQNMNPNIGAAKNNAAHQGADNANALYDRINRNIKSE